MVSDPAAKFANRAAETPAVSESLSQNPANRAFGPRGRRLWAACFSQCDGERGVVLLEEACRIADRLDRLDEILTGQAEVWAILVHDLRTEDYELRIDGALIEARQQAATLRQILTSLPVKEAPGGDDDDDPDVWLDDVPT
jgi:hypothetical protein